MTPLQIIFMGRTRRIMFEILAPVPLGAIGMLIISGTSESLSDLVTQFPVFLVVAYLFGIIPSFFYALFMEMWFRSKFHKQDGFVFTVVLSAFLGLMGGLCIHAMSVTLTKASEIDMLRFAGIGSLVGLIMGLYIAFYFGRKDVNEQVKPK